MTKNFKSTYKLNIVIYLKICLLVIISICVWLMEYIQVPRKKTTQNKKGENNFSINDIFQVDDFSLHKILIFLSKCIIIFHKSLTAISHKWFSIFCFIKGQYNSPLEKAADINLYFCCTYKVLSTGGQATNLSY